MSDFSHLITTMSGKKFDFDNPAATPIGIQDVAIALGHVCRFGGHIRQFYSVAEHAVLVHDLVRAAGGSPVECFAALHHDTHEAFLGDVPTPLKMKIMAEAPGMWEAMESSINAAICDWYGIMPSMLHTDRLTEADRLALSLEGEVLKPESTTLIRGVELTRFQKELAWQRVRCLDHDMASSRFLATHDLARGRVDGAIVRG